ncbi:MAG TPA: hypothetical protein VFE62_29985 [Gemmataceae bacterium]|nr:hypothetical protein [Gemmataceae bacterium]
MKQFAIGCRPGLRQPSCIVLAPSQIALELNAARERGDNKHQPKQVSQAELKPSAHWGIVAGREGPADIVGMTVVGYSCAPEF